ncbi:mucin-5AC-like isoform X5 [Daphnia pulicaria]|nr:mucin-5AC-like isoform X5 [Daphnia pulicaria]
MVVNGGSSQQQQPTPAPPPPPDVNNIMGGIEQTVGVRMHNHRRKLRQRFDLVRKLGQGTYGKVQLGINKETGQEVAIKTIKKAKIETEADLIRIRREIQIMSSVRHPNIIHIYEVFENKEKMVLVMEYAAGGELYDYLSQRKVLNEAEARRVFRQVASAVYYCHKHNICHRDLKLENILLDESKTAKIADFGLSNVFDDRRLLTTFCGSPLYASPEIVRGTPYHGPEVDCWSLGVLLYTLVYGAMPFDGSNFKRLVKQISSGEYYEPPDKPSTASPLVRHMLLVDPAKRANVEDICSHWWVNEGYGESCLEVAEELANQTPVRLDLLLSLVPPPESTDTVVVSAKTDQPASTQASKEGDSMNEYYSAAEPSTSDAAKSGGVKKKKESSSQSGKEADKASTVKRRRAETDQVKSADDSTTTTMTPEGRGGCPAVGDLDAQNSAGPSPIDDSGIQTSLREEEEEELVTGVVQSAPEEVRTKSTSSEAKTKCDVMTDVDMDEGISTSSQADDRRSSVPIASCMAANPASAALAPCTIMTNNNNPSQSSSPSANATTTTSTTSTSSIPHCSSVSQHSPATSAFRQTTTTTTVTVGDVSTLSPPIAPTTANAEIEMSHPPPLLDGRPTCAAPAAPAQVPEAPESLVVASTGQSESHAAMAGKMDAKGAVPAANVVTEPPEPENTVALISPTNATPPPPPPSLNQVPPPPPPFTLGPEKTESAGDSSGATTAGSTATATPPPKEGAAPSGSGSNRSESSAANAAPPASVALANRRPANTNKAAGPANAAEQRHSKILRQAEIFNSLVLTHSRNEPPTTGPKSTMTLERPKKVTIFSYKLNDTRRPTETRTEPKVPTIVPVLKVSDAKRAFENNAAAAQQQRNSSIGSAASGHHHNSLPRRTLIQTPASISTDAMVPKSLNQQRAGHAASMATMTATTTTAQESTNSSQGVEPGEKVVVGGLGVKIGAIGKVTEIGMKVKTEENNHQSENQTTPKDTKTSQPVQNDDSLKPQQGSSSADSSEKKLPEQLNAEQEVQVAVEKSEVASPVPVKEVQPPTKVSTKKVKESESLPSALPAQEPEEPKVREIPVMLDTGELETKVASILAAPGRSPPKDPPAPRPTSLPTPVSSSTPSPKATGQVSSSATERMTSPPPKPIRVASPPPLRIASPPPRPVRIASPSPPAVAHKIINASTRTVSPPPPLIRPSADQSPNQRPLSPSTLPSSRPMSPVYASSMTSTDRTDDDCIAGSENAFIRGIRSPTREHPAPAAIPPLNKRFSKGPGDMPENAMVMVEAKPIQKAEINIAVNVASTSTNPRERIIPIRVEGRVESTAAAVAGVGGLVASESSKAVPKSLNSISVQLRATPPRVASPPPPPAQPIKPVPIRPSSASRQESIQNPGPAMATAESVSLESKKFLREPVRESAREPIRKSPREFIIPITVEGVSASHPAATETASSSSASMRTSRFDRTKRYGSLYHEGETDFDISQTSGDVDNHAASPLHHLQRLSSFKKSHDEPETSRGRRGSDSSIDDDIDDDDDTFQILTAESLFSTLLSRVRQLTKRNQRAESNAADPFVVFRNSSRFTSPAPSAGGRSRATDVSDIHREFEDASSQISTPGCTSPNAHHHNNNNRNSTGSDLLAGSASNKGFWNNVYSRASSVASESDARRYSTLDPPRFHPTETPQLQPPPSSAGVPSGLPWRRDTSVEGESNCSIASASMSQRVRLQHQLGSADGGDRKRVTLTLHVTEPAARAPPSSPTASDWFRPECRRRHDPNPEQENKGPAETGAGTVVSFKCFVLSHPSASTAYHSPSAVNGDVNNATPASSRPFTSSLTRRKLNQHLRETNPELVGSPGQNGNHQQNNSDAMSDTSSTSAGNRSSLSWALSRFTGGVADSAKPTGRSVRDQQQQQPQYNRTKSSRELGNEPQQRTYQRYGRSSTLDNLEPDSSTAPSSASTAGYFHRIGSPFSDDENPNSGVSTPASYRTYTRTRSREYMSPTSSRGTSPVPSSSIAALPSISTTMSSPDAVANMTMNPIVPQLSTVLENGPLGVEGESSPRQTRAAESKLAAITSLNSTNPIPVSVPAPAPISAPNPPAAPTSENADGTIERKSRRVSRFLRPDFYDAPKEESSTEKQRFLKSVEQRWEKYNPDAGLMALSKTTNSQTAGSTQTIERPAAPISKDRATGSLTSTPPSPLQPILKARQSLTPIPAPAQPNLSLPPPSSSIVLKPVPEQPQVEPTTNKIPQQVMLKPVSVEPQQQQQQQQSAPKSNGNAPSSKNSPKLTVRRQFEHLINLAAAQFQRSSSPNKVAPAAPAQTPASTSTTITPPTPVVSTAAVAQPPTTIQQPPDTISLELKQLEDEIKNTAAIKAQASARLDALKYEHAVRSGAAAIPPSGIPKPAIPVKPIYLVARPVQEIPSVSPDLPIVPPEFQPFQYKGSNGTLRELSHRSNNNNRRDALSPPPAGANENGTISPFADEAVRFARIIKRFESQPYENSWASDAMGIDNAAPGTPTDSYESSSVCSDLRGDQRDSGEDESVSERIFRKSFYSRFNEPTKTKHRRSMTRELEGGEGGEGNLPITDAQPPISRRSSQHRKSLSGRDESVDRIGLSETVMVRKFLSSGDANGGGNFDRERRLSASRRHPSVSEYSDATVDVIHPRRSMSREVSVARSVKSDTQPPQVTSPTPSVAGSDSGDRAGTAGREVRSYARTYSSSRALANDLPPSGNGESYSSASLGRRSYYPVSSTSTNADHISSLPRRSSNR